MSNLEQNGEDEIDESGRNPTQQRMDEQEGGGEAVPVDAEWPTGKDAAEEE
jgi:hypothetical protein